MSTKTKVSQYEKMTGTPIPSLIISLSIPTIITMMVSNIYNMVDTYFVSRLGNSASGAIGIVFGYMSIIQACGFLFGQGGGSIVSRMLGAKDTDSASKYASVSFFSSFIIATLIAALSYTQIDDLMYFLGSTETIAPYAKEYTIYIMISAPFMASSFTLNNILRYEGKAALGMAGMMTGGILNMALDPVFMFYCGMGVSGAGLSTCLSQIISFCILISMFVAKRTSSRISYRLFAGNLSAVGLICATGLPSLLRQGLNSVATIILNNRAAVYGDAAVAAMSIVSRIGFMMLSVALGIGQGFQPVSGFNYGAKKYSRVRKAYKFTWMTAEALILVVISGMLAVSGQMIRIFRDDYVVIAIGTRALRLLCVSMAFLPVSIMTEMMYQSTGHKLGASLLSCMRSGLFFIPALLILSELRGLPGIQEAQPLAHVLSFFPSIIFALHFFSKLPKEDGTE